MSNWVYLDRSVSPTKAATEMAAALPDAINLGQGREIDNPGGDIGKLLRGEITPDSKYNGDVGGSGDLREEAADWAHRFLGLPSLPESTWVLQALGRAALDLAFGIAAQSPDRKKVVLRGDLGWPMTDELAATTA